MSEELAGGDDNVLLGIIKREREKGKSFVEIERMFKIPAAQAEAMYSTFMRNRQQSIDPDEYRLLQLDRLEGLIDVLQSQVALGNSKSAEILLKLLEQISELLGLNQQVQRSEIKIITEVQGTAVFDLAWAMAQAILKQIIMPMMLAQGWDKEFAQLEDVYAEKVTGFFGEAITQVIEPELKAVHGQ